MPEHKLAMSTTTTQASKNGHSFGTQFSGPITINGESFMYIDGIEQFPVFFLTMVSASNHWFFIASNGSLSAGRESPESALFPYYTVDRIMDDWNCTGPQTIVLSDDLRWEPFKPHTVLQFNIKRRLYKSLLSNSLIFEEINHELQLKFTYQWQTSEKYGFVRTCELSNIGDTPKDLVVVDGLANILPSNVGVRMQQSMSCLVDAYKLSELDENNQLLTHRLASGIVDEPVPVECLTATVAWSLGWPHSNILHNPQDVESFLSTGVCPKNIVARGTRGCFYNAGKVKIEPLSTHSWIQVADVEQSQKKVGDLSVALKDSKAMQRSVAVDIKNGNMHLAHLVAAADGQQLSGESIVSAHHCANVLFNIMRGGVFDNSYQIDRNQLDLHLRNSSGDNRVNFEAWINELPNSMSIMQLVDFSETTDPQVRRACMEYLPLVFSRRHGDPSRPWNLFSIKTKDASGFPVVGFQGNWRDIFQNWEALSWSYPNYNLAFIRKFLNASTADGYNPYRITNNGIEWEEPDDSDPWASIGYWGDHQIIYLLKLLEFSDQVSPGWLANNLASNEFVFADVPYEIKSFAELERDPNNSINFNFVKNEAIKVRVSKYGADGKLVHGHDGKIVHAQLIEKLLIPLLIKLSNFVPAGGIWMNTQRPEWNDANNALAGFGLSVVTTGYLNRYIEFLSKILPDSPVEYELYESIINLISELNDVFANLSNTDLGDDGKRYVALNALGISGQKYRECIYAYNYNKKSKLSLSDLRSLLANARRCISDTLHTSKLKNNLYHSYNILQLDPIAKCARIRHLDLMLEGQVSALSSGLIGGSDACKMLSALKASELYCKERNSYMLYANKVLPSFLEFNRVELHKALDNNILKIMLSVNDHRILEPVHDDMLRFVPSIKNAYDLRDVISNLGADYTHLEDFDLASQEILDLFELTFKHDDFTGRSGTMFAYEGLGSIYWHMVSKLMLATLEAYNNEPDTEVKKDLSKHYYSIQGGLGFRKTAKQYGAFPADAYSHTPLNGGAQQPGLTGMVKEGILARFGELGVQLVNGAITFNPTLIRTSELLVEKTQVDLILRDKTTHTFTIEKGSMLFTLMQLPVIYQFSNIDSEHIEMHLKNGLTEHIESTSISQSLSQKIFSRDQTIRHLIVDLNLSRLLD